MLVSVLSSSWEPFFHFFTLGCYWHLSHVMLFPSKNCVLCQVSPEMSFLVIFFDGCCFFSILWFAIRNERKDLQRLKFFIVCEDWNFSLFVRNWGIMKNQLWNYVVRADNVSVHLSVFRFFPRRIRFFHFLIEKDGSNRKSAFSRMDYFLQTHCFH